MKRLSVILLFVLTLVSCTRNTNDIAAGLETYRDVYTEETEDGENVLPYIPPEEEAAVTGILAEEFTIHDGKYYFGLKHAFDRGGGVRMLAYADVETGNYGIVCQDHLCPHNSPKVCKYAELDYFRFTDKPGVFYAVRMTSEMYLCRIDLNEDTVENIKKLDFFGWNLLGYSDGRMYFSENVTVTKDKQTVSELRISYVEDATREIVQLELPEEEWPYRIQLPRFVWNGGFYIFTDQKIIRTDPTNSDTSVIADLGMNISQWYMDTGTGELYFSCVDQNNHTGSVYVVKDGGAPDKLPLPHEEIYTFTLNHNKIYYTTYDPVYLGTSGQAFHDPGNEDAHGTYDYTGGKLYAVDRYHPSEAEELAYEVSGIALDKAARLESAVVMGDYLYIDEIDILREVKNGREYVSFDYARNVSKLRIGLRDGSLVRITFE